ncbi:MAG: PKD domain-containing protein, partial [Deltaproteobacteria bacterium]|nr:PKD domain-containing protein [Deltaproteobacteria bacterium]
AADIAGPAKVRIDEVAAFDGSGSTDPDGTIAKHEWDFDYDGQNFGADATGPKVAKSYAKAGPYLVALRVTDNDGGQNLTTQALVVTPNQAPAAAISGPAKVRVDAVASFDAGLSSDADGVVVKYEWDFGYDGQNFAADVSGPKVNQFYAQAGSYLVALRVTDNDGAQGLTTHAIEVTPNQAPAAAITGPAKVRVNEIASFDASLSSDADGVVVLQEWDFDYDGNNFDVQATGPKTNGSYPQAGSYLVALRVTDNDGAQDVTTHALAVTPNQPPQAAISGPSQADVGALLSLSGAGSTDADGTIADYEWDFDYDGQSFDVEATGAQVNTSFPQAGSYLVALRVTDNDGAQGLTTQALTIEPLSELAVLDVTPGSGPRRGGEQVTITGTGFTSVPDTVVTFDGVPAVVLSVPSYDTMTARTPAGIPGPADVAVTNSNGAAELPDGYVYEGESNRAGTAFCWIDATAGTNLGFPVNADDLTRPTTVGFDFGFFGELFPAGADLYVTSNGWASFSESQAMFQHFAIPSPSNPSHLVAPLFFDQRIGPTGAVYARTTGVQPNRRLAVEWKDVTDAGGAARFRYQAVLFEGSDDVALQYRNSAQFDYNPLNDAAAGASALIGIQNADGSAGAQYARNAFLTGLAPGGRTVVFRPQPDGSYDIDSGTTLSVAGTDLPPGARLGNGGTVKLWLSKPIDATTAVANSSVRVNNLTDGGTVPVVLSLAPSKDVLYVTVPAGLVTGKNYELRLTTAVKDLAGKPLSQDPMGLSCGSNSPTDYASAFTYFPRSCLDIKLGSPAAPSGLYSIDPDGGVGQAPFTVYCEMTANGGGWTLLMKIDGNQATFDYDAALWTNTNTLNPGSPNLDMTQAKLLGFGTMPFTALRLGMLVGGVTRWIVVPHTASSLLSRFVGGAVVTSAGRNAWKSLFPAPSLQPFCDWEGFNVGVAGAARARIGIVSNENGVGDCSSPDSRIGFGTDGNFCGQDDANTCGNEARCGGDGGDVSTRAFGYVMIR